MSVLAELGHYWPIPKAPPHFLLLDTKMVRTPLPVAEAAGLPSYSPSCSQSVYFRCAGSCRLGPGHPDSLPLPASSLPPPLPKEAKIGSCLRPKMK